MRDLYVKEKARFKCRDKVHPRGHEDCPYRSHDKPAWDSDNISQITYHIHALGVVLTEMYNTLDSVKVLLQKAQDRRKSCADKKRREHTFKTRQQVLLSRT